MNATSFSSAPGVADAVRGALWGLFVGDALSAPLHWYYTWPEAQRHKLSYYGGGIRGYSGAHPDAAHPDSWKYFARCDPRKEPVPAIFTGDEAGTARADSWRTPGTNYHAALPAGDNTLTARLTALVGSSLTTDGRFDAEAYFQRYTVLLAGQKSGPGLAEAWAHGGAASATAVDGSCPADSGTASDPRGLLSHNRDTWVDESHRVLARNCAVAGARPWEAGLDDCCLTGIAMSVPLLLAYSGNRDARELAVRSLLQLTHKSEDMVRQVMWFGDLLSVLLANARASDAAKASDNPPTAHASDSESKESNAAPDQGVAAAHSFDVGAAFEALFTTYSDGKISLPEVAARFAPRPRDTGADPSGPPASPLPAAACEDDPSAEDEPAFHGPAAVFSVR